MKTLFLSYLPNEFSKEIVEVLGGADIIYVDDEVSGKDFIEDINISQYQTIIVPRAFSARNEDYRGFDVAKKILDINKDIKVIMYDANQPDMISPEYEHVLKPKLDEAKIDYCSIDYKNKTGYEELASMLKNYSKN